MKVVAIVGARPQFIKAAVVSRALAKRDIEEVIVHTGQHYDPSMSDIFFEEMDIPRPAHHLGLGGLSHGAMTGRMLERIESVLVTEQPDWIVVYGDTNSTLAGALAAAKLGIPVAHVEAGVRSFNMAMPEEINRILADRISTLLLLPTERARHNLRREGFDAFPSRMVAVGDVMYDAFLHYSVHPQANRKKHGEGFVLFTLHRAASTDEPAVLKGIVQALNHISQQQRVIFPVHPRTRRKLRELDTDLRCDVVEPVGYLEMLDLLRHCSMVLTDSGGLQKEAYFFGKPCVTLRTDTEWPELVDLGCNRLVGVDPDEILIGWRQFRAQAMDYSARPFGDGDAGDRIAAELLRRAAAGKHGL